ncbi:MAG TPA: hypothetical protein VMW62_00085 [Chloroflexota bacterium]|nr:hypothetical protein [Chloroflexota bacterium]
MAVDIRTKLEVLDPTVEPAPVSARMAPRLSTLEGKRIGLLDNGKPHAKELLEWVEQLLEERVKPAQVVRFRKPNSSKPAPGEFIVDITKQVDAVINGVGD